ncbi:DUF4386 domain-containing protein [Ningiella sp. W23]|uniref:DUF4386 domain-containing protein n=1 Tax=Ningiella sp. W23 TaxID=3023715 RepID=UPI003756E295
MVGLLFIISTGSYLTASELISGVLSSPNFIEHVFPSKNLLTLAALLEFINSASVVGVAIVMLPIIRPFSQRIALTYLSFRIVEAIMLLTGTVALLSLITLSEEFLKSSTRDVEYLFILAEMLKDERYFSFQLGMIPLALCGFSLCMTFYQYRLVPRLLSALGLLGYLLLLLKVTFDFFAINFGGEYLYMPGALFELLLPFWLFIKGFGLAEIQTDNMQH